VSWRRIVLAAGVLLVLLLAGSWWWLWHTASGARFIWARADAASGGLVHIESLEGSLSSGLVAQGLEFSNDGFTLSVDEIRAQPAPGLLPLSIHIANARVSGVQLQFRRGDAEREPTGLATVLARLRLPLALSVEALEVRQILVVLLPADTHYEIDLVRLDGRWSDDITIDSLYASAPRNELNGSGTLQLAQPQNFALQARLAAEDTRLNGLEALSATARIQGVPEDFLFAASADATIADRSPLHGEAEGSGNLQALNFRNATVVSEELDASGSGRMSWNAGLAASADIQVARAELHRLVAEWPDEHPISGTLSADYANGEIRLQDAELAALDSDLQALASGFVDLSTGTLEGNLDWTGFEWPLATGEPRIKSREGRVALSGTLDAWTVAGQVDLAAAGVEDGVFGLQAHGNRDRVDAQITDGQVLGGAVAGTLSASWREARPWSADLTMNGLQVGALWPDWRGALTGHVIASGQVEPLEIEAQLDDVNGNFMGYPLTASGGIEFRGNALQAQDLRVANGPSEIRLNGSLDTPDGVRFVARSGQLGNYFPDVAGDLSATGELRRENGEPVLRADLGSDHLSLAGKDFYDSTLRLIASETGQDATLQSHFRDLAFDIALAGALDDWRSPGQWRGSIDRFIVTAPDENSKLRRISLRDPVEILASADNARVGRFCLDGALEAEVCAEAAWAEGRSFDLSTTIDALPANHINQFFDTGFVLDQRLTGVVDVQIANGSEITGKADIALTPGRISSKERGDLVVQTGAGQISMDVQDGVLLTGDVRLPLPGTGQLNASLAVHDVQDIQNSAISGEINIDADNIQLLQVLVPAIGDASGVLHSRISLSGTTAKPLAAGTLNLQGGRFEYRPVGLKLSDIEIQSSFDENQRFSLDGSFRAGAGYGQLRSRGVYSETRASGIFVELSGENLQVIDVPEVQATANPDLRIGYRDGSLRIDGKLLVPHAHIEPRQLPEVGKSTSDDVVIVAGELDGEKEQAPQTTLSMHGGLEVTLGDDVTVELDLAEAKVTGTTKFSWDGPLLPLANGRFELNGDVQAYGQVLEISEGGIRFPKVPADNPTLRIRAEREIFGNSQIKRAGVLVGGTLKQPTIQAYTEPRTTEERALTLLVTGSDFDLEQGVGAVDFGTYIAPKLFVSYGVGLFDRENVISARYDLGKGFGVKATSGQKESGVDLIYRVER
jgi:translocation and assembly module TamB